MTFRERSGNVKITLKRKITVWEQHSSNFQATFQRLLETACNI